MKDLGAQLRSNLIQQATNKQWDENPLITIGLSPEFLELGLDDDALFELSKRWAKYVLASVHPDKMFNKQVDNDKIEKFSNAFDLIKERLIFDEALREFKLLKSEDRSQHNELQRRVSNLSNELKIAQEKIQAYELQNRKPAKQAAEVKQVVKDLKKTEQTGIVPEFMKKPIQDFRRSQGIYIGFRDLLEHTDKPKPRITNTKAIEQPQYILAIRLKMEVSRAAPDFDRLPEIERLYNEALALHQMKKPRYASKPSLSDLLNEARVEFSRAKFQLGNLSDVLAKAKRHSGRYPRIRWGLKEAYHHYGFKFVETLQEPREVIPKHLKENPEFPQDFIIRRFYEGVEEITKRLLNPIWIQSLDWYPVILQMTKGFFRETGAGRAYTYNTVPNNQDFRVVGSFQQKSELIYEAMQSNLNLSESMVHNHVHPLLQSGSFMVDVTNSFVLQSGKTSEQQITNFYTRLQNLNRIYRTGYYILELK